MSGSCRRVLEYIRSCEHSPSLREIGEAVGLRSSSTVFGHVQRLRVMGLLEPAPRSMPRHIFATNLLTPDRLTPEERHEVETARLMLATSLDPCPYQTALLAVVDRLAPPSEEQP